MWAEQAVARASPPETGAYCRVGREAYALTASQFPNDVCLWFREGGELAYSHTASPASLEDEVGHRQRV